MVAASITPSAAGSIACAPGGLADEAGPFGSDEDRAAGPRRERRELIASSKDRPDSGTHPLRSSSSNTSPRVVEPKYGMQTACKGGATWAEKIGTMLVCWSLASVRDSPGFSADTFNATGRSARSSWRAR